MSSFENHVFFWEKQIISQMQIIMCEMMAVVVVGGFYWGGSILNND